MKSCVQVGPLRTADGEMIADSAGIFVVLNKQFTPVFIKEDCAIFPHLYNCIMESPSLS